MYNLDLSHLVQDRRNRKYVRECVENAESIAEHGYCKSCRSHGKVSKVLGVALCENCQKELIALTNRNDVVIEESSKVDAKYLVGLLNEGTLYFDMQKMQDEADRRFGGSIEALVRSYDCPPLKVMPEAGKINFQSQVTKKGKSRINQLMIDFDGQFANAKSAIALPPDNDGTVAPKMVRGIGLIDPDNYEEDNTSSTSSIPTPAKTTTAPVNPNKTAKTGTSAVTPKTTINATPKVPKAPSASKSASSQTQVTPVPVAQSTQQATYAHVDIPNIMDFSYQLASDLQVLITNISVGIKYVDFAIALNSEIICSDRVDVKTSIDEEGLKNLIKAEVLDTLVNKPMMCFDAFEGINSGEFSIYKYGIYKFGFDEKSFDGNTITLCTIFNGKKSNNAKDRVEVTYRDLSSATLLSKKLTDHMDVIAKRNFPVLMGNDNKVKTSMGTFTFTLKDMQSKGVMLLDMDTPNDTIEVSISADVMKNVENAKKAFYQCIESHMNTIIKAYNTFEWSKGTFPRTSKKYKYNSDTIEVRAMFNSTVFEVTGNFDFVIDIKVNNTVYPTMDGDVYTYTHRYKSFDDFMFKAGCDIYDKYVSVVNGADSDLSSSALDKLNNPSKKFALFRKIASTLKRKMDSKGIKLDGALYDDYSLDLEMKVNARGYVTAVTVSFTDDSEEYENPKDYEKALSKGLVTMNMFKFSKVNRDGSVMYEVTDIDAFCNMVNMKAFESAILEAFELVCEGIKFRKCFEAVTQKRIRPFM